MATENLSYNDAVYIIKYIINKSNSFSSIVANNVKRITVASISLNNYDDSFPVFNSLPNKSNAYIKHKKKRKITFLLIPSLLSFIP